MKKETEIEGLARMVANSFSTLEKNMETMIDGRIESLKDHMDERFGSLEAEVHSTNERMDSFIVPTLDDHARRIKDLELVR